MFTATFVLGLYRRPLVTVSEGLAQGPYMLASVGFEPATLQTQGTDRTTEATMPTKQLNADLFTGKTGNVALQFAIFRNLKILVDHSCGYNSMVLFGFVHIETLEIQR